MKLKCTINVGNYSNITIESSEHANIVYAKAEIVNIAKGIKEPPVTDFVNKYFNKEDDPYAKVYMS